MIRARVAELSSEKQLDTGHNEDRARRICCWVGCAVRAESAVDVRFGLEQLKGGGVAGNWGEGHEERGVGSPEPPVGRAGRGSGPKSIGCESKLELRAEKQAWQRTTFS